MHGTWTSKDWNQRSDADEESLPTLTVSSLRGVLEVSNVTFVFHLLCLQCHFDLPLHACFNKIGQMSCD